MSVAIPTTAANSRTFTPEEFIDLPENERFELVRGHLVENAMSLESQWTAGQISFSLNDHVMRNKLGRVYPDGTTYQCFNALAHDPFLLRRPDCSFIRKGRVSEDQYKSGYCRAVPDLVVEVISPTDTYKNVTQRVHEFREVGCPLIWVIDPDSRTALVYRGDHSVTEVGEEDVLDGGDVVPGFSVKLASVLTEPGSAGTL